MEKPSVNRTQKQKFAKPACWRFTSKQRLKVFHIDSGTKRNLKYLTNLETPK